MRISCLFKQVYVADNSRISVYYSSNFHLSVAFHDLQMRLYKQQNLFVEKYYDSIVFRRNTYELERSVEDAEKRTKIMPTMDIIYIIIQLFALLCE